MYFMVAARTAGMSALPAASDEPAAARTNRSAIAAAAAPRVERMVRISDLHRELVDLGRRVTGPLVDPHHRIPRRTAGKAEDLARLRIEPGPLVDDALVVLDREIAVVRVAQLLGGHAEEPVVDIHELGHRIPPWCRGDPRLARTLAGDGVPVIGRPTDGRPQARPISAFRRHAALHFSHRCATFDVAPWPNLLGQGRATLPR